MTERIEDRAMMIVAECMDKYNNHPICAHKYLSFPKISFTLRGHTAGWATATEINLNLSIMNDERYPDALFDTVVHEMAHVIDRTIHGYKRGQSHGIGWQHIMFMLDASPERCHHYNTKAARKTRKFNYTCLCGKPHIIGTVGHNRHQKRNQTYYICKSCDGFLRFDKEIK